MTGQLRKRQRRLLAHREQTHHRPFVLRQPVPAIARGPGIGKRAVEPADHRQPVARRQRHLPRRRDPRQLFGRPCVEPSEQVAHRSSPLTPVSVSFLIIIPSMVEPFDAVVHIVSGEGVKETKEPSEQRPIRDVFSWLSGEDHAGMFASGESPRSMRPTASGRGRTDGRHGDVCGDPRRTDGGGRSNSGWPPPRPGRPRPNSQSGVP